METALANLAIDKDKWDPVILSSEELETFYPVETPLSDFEVPSIEKLANPKLDKHLMDKHTLPQILVLYAIDQECRHISHKVKKLRINKKGNVAPYVISPNGPEQHFWPAYGKTFAARFRHNDYLLYKLASRGSNSDHLDTVDFYVKNFGPQR